MRVRWGRIILTILLISVFGVYTTITIIGTALNNLPKPPRISDNTPPTVVMNGRDIAIMAVNMPYLDAGVEAFYDMGEVKITTTGEVDTSKEGEYTIW